MDNVGHCRGERYSWQSTNKMKKTEWFYDHDEKNWWMVSVSTNAKHIPKIKLGEHTEKPSLKVKVKGINLHDENKRLWGAIYALSGCVGISLGVILVLLVV